MSIRRLDPDTNVSKLPIMVPADDGGYVDYDDHVAEVEALEARVAELEAALRRSETLANGIIERNQGGYVGDWNDTKEILATVRAALAAEKGDDHE